MLDATHTIVKLLPGTYTLGVLPVLLRGGQAATVYGTGAMLVVNQTSIALTEGSQLELHGVSIALGAGATQNLLTCSGTTTINSKLSLFDTTLKAGAQYAIDASACDGTIERSGFSGSQDTLINVGPGPADRRSTFSIDRATFSGGTAVVSGGGNSANAVTITNSVFRNAGTSVSGAVVGYTPGALTVSFSTFIDSQIIDCANPPIGTPAPMTFSNNIMFGTTGSTVSNDGTGCIFTYDLMSPQTTALTNADHLIRNASPKFRDATNGDYHLLSGSPAIDAADPAATLGDDFDGVMRPQGSHRDMGAFEYKP